VRALLAAYEEGRTDIQHRLLDEVEPLLFGYVRSLGPPGDPELAVRRTQALTLAFHLRACAGRLDVASIQDLRGYAHRMALEKLADDDPLELAPLADEETGSMIYKCYGLGLTLESELTRAEIDAFEARLSGRDADAAAWSTALPKLVRLGIAP
jgi:hypothetical protein